MAFDFQSGMRGAQAGSVAGPYGAIAGFVVGGFIGGGKMKKAKAKAKREQRLYRQHLQTITSPEYFGKTIQKMLPSMRESVASGIGPQMQSDIATSLARGGYTGTGVGEVGRAVGIAMPEIEAFRQATAQATPALNREIEGFLANARSKGIDVGYGGGQPLPDPFGSAGPLVDTMGKYGSMMMGGAMGGGMGGGMGMGMGAGMGGGMASSFGGNNAFGALANPQYYSQPSSFFRQMYGQPSNPWSEGLPGQYTTWM